MFLQSIKQNRQMINQDKKNLIESIHNVFDQIHDFVDERRIEVLTQVKQEFRSQLNEVDDICKCLGAVLKRCQTLFPQRVPDQALSYIKSLEKILDFQSDMVGVNRDVLEQLKTMKKTENLGVGRQRMQTAQIKTVSMLNSFRLDFSGQVLAVKEKI